MKRVFAERKRTGEVGHDVPKCRGCKSPMTKSSERHHYLHRQLLKCWTCKRKCNAGMYGVPVHGESAGTLIRLDLARNPNTGEKVRIPWRHKESSYEKRYGLVWCDQTSRRPDGCGSILTYQRPHSSGLSIFGHQNREFCKKYLGQPVYCWAGKVVDKPERTSLLPKKARICPHCKGRVYRRMGEAYSLMNPLRAERPELVRCHCTVCKRTLYFNVRLGRFQDDLPIGMRPVDDPHRPSCRECGPTHRFALRARTFAKNPLLAPMSVRIRLKGTKAKGNEIVAIRYSCCHRVTWKFPDGKLITRRSKDSNDSRAIRPPDPQPVRVQQLGPAADTQSESAGSPA